eukprot:scaffold11822_cov120-Isochrysis_galbana.AAC.2
MRRKRRIVCTLTWRGALLLRFRVSRFRLIAGQSALHGPRLDEPDHRIPGIQRFSCLELRGEFRHHRHTGKLTWTSGTHHIAFEVALIGGNEIPCPPSK